MNDSKDNQLKAQKIYTQTLEYKPRMHTSELTIQRQFDDKDTFITAKEQVDEANADIEKNLESIIQPPKRKRFLAGGL